jgi:hypothetical protein
MALVSCALIISTLKVTARRVESHRRIKVSGKTSKLSKLTNRSHRTAEWLLGASTLTPKTPCSSKGLERDLELTRLELVAIDLIQY